MCVTDVHGTNCEITEQTAFRIGSIRNATFNSQLRNKSVFQGTGGKPKEETEWREESERGGGRRRRQSGGRRSQREEEVGKGDRVEGGVRERRR